MAIFRVWHADNPNFHDATPETLAAFPAGFTHVADVETDYVGRVFELTNHIDSDWRRNSEVVLVAPGLTWPAGVRSTSVGDIYEVMRDGKVVAHYAVNGLGLRSF